MSHPSLSNSKTASFGAPLVLTILGMAVAPICLAADSPKVKVLHSGRNGDGKPLKIVEAKVKTVLTQDSEHPKVLEVVMDYSKAGTFPGIGKDFGPGELKKYSAVRFWLRSETGTGFVFSFQGDYKRKDRKSTTFSSGLLKGSENWTLVNIPLDKLTRQSIKDWDKEKKEPVTIPGGDSMDEQDLAGISRWQVTSSIERRGSSSVGQLVFDSIELVEK